MVPAPRETSRAPARPPRRADRGGQEVLDRRPPSGPGARPRTHRSRTASSCCHEGHGRVPRLCRFHPASPATAAGLLHAQERVEEEDRDGREPQDGQRVRGPAGVGVAVDAQHPVEPALDRRWRVLVKVRAMKSPSGTCTRRGGGRAGRSGAGPPWCRSSVVLRQNFSGRSSAYSRYPATTTASTRPTAAVRSPALQRAHQQGADRGQGEGQGDEPDVEHGNSRVRAGRTPPPQHRGRLHRPS